MGRPDQQPTGTDRQFLRTAALFGGLVVSGNILVYLLACRDWLWFLNLLTTDAALGLIRASGLEAAATDNVIRLRHAVWIVDTECTGINLWIIFSGFILVYPAPWQAKGLGLLSGLPFLFGANILRLWAMALVDRFQPAYSAYFHDYLWQVVFLIGIACMWLFWINKVVNRAAGRQVPS